MRKFSSNQISEAINEVVMALTPEAIEAINYFREHNLPITAHDKDVRTLAYVFAKEHPKFKLTLGLMLDRWETNAPQILEMILQEPEMEVYRKALALRPTAYNAFYTIGWICQTLDSYAMLDEVIETKGECLKVKAFSKEEIKEFENIYKSFSAIDEKFDLLQVAYLFKRCETKERFMDGVSSLMKE